MNFDAIDNNCNNTSHLSMINDLVVATTPAPVRRKYERITPVYVSEPIDFNHPEIKSWTTAIVWFTVAFAIASFAMFALMLT